MVEIKQQKLEGSARICFRGPSKEELAHVPACWVADCHGAETAPLVVKGGMASSAIFLAIPHACDGLVFGKFIHASVHDGMKHNLVSCQKSFRYNNIGLTRKPLEGTRNSQQLLSESPMV
ncbi:aminotransferase class I and II [Colletotrichum higginsianum IMI 349063]|uniref:Aminotransferase class I and II n=1 Tax=Colletotrichum higginsianum (strain IMI 349063) TaxID=759273 RepID=A0A1B7XRP9_COLHI|nr:aminotransferase class I and II [Colletotrichum higginsianum IMI 349063]OBR02439.1 aminotransferase class I and II [Colletotrichum higginsianum IMI 349063]